MTYDELLSEVYLITNRPDLAAETATAVKSATLKAHRLDFFSKDIFELGVQFEASSFRQQLDYINLISNFRAFKYFRLASSATDDTGKFLAIITVDEILDSYGINRTDIAYVAGRVIEIRATNDFQFGLLGCYVNPIVTPADKYSSWVAEQFPFAIIQEAAKKVFNAIGQPDKARTASVDRDEEYSELLASAITDVGY